MTTMAQPDSTTRLRETLARKLTKRDLNTARTSMDAMQRLHEGSDDERDVCAPRPGGLNLNQSIFGLIAAAGSAAGFDENLSDSEPERDHTKVPISQTVPTLAPTAAGARMDGTSHARRASQRRKSSKTLLAKSLHKLRLKPVRERSGVVPAEDPMSSSQILNPRQQDSESEEEEDEQDATLANAPHLSKVLNADVLARKDLEAADTRAQRVHDPTGGPLGLAEQVQKLFRFKEKQDIIAEYRCQLVQNVNVPGYIFVTKQYICFYAYLPTARAKVVKSGYVSKRGLHDPRYHRFYCELKGHVLSFYEDRVQINYPRSLVDMRRTSKVFLTGQEKGKDDTHFTLETDKRQYQLKADSAESANDWLKLLQQELLKTHNDGGLVKITLPVDNILDIEDNYIRGMAFSESLRIRVIDNDETYAVEEYYFTFDSRGQEAIRVLKLMVQTREEPAYSELANREVHVPEKHKVTDAGRSAMPAWTAPLKENVQSTLDARSPSLQAPPRSRLSTESRTSSLDMAEQRGRTRIDEPGSPFVSRHESNSPSSQHPQDPLDFPQSPLTTSADQDTESSVAIQSLDETIEDVNASESQLLNRSDVFQVPTIHSPASQRAKPESRVDRLHRMSQDTARTYTGSSPPREQGVGSMRQSVAPHISTEAIDNSDNHPARLAGSNYSLGRLVKAGMSPLQSASGIAGYLNKQSKQMSSLLATESMGYYEKVAGMWHGGSRHYASPYGAPQDDNLVGDHDEAQATKDAQRFREHFALPDSEQLLASWHCYAQRTLPLYGKLYLGSTHLCWRPLMARTTKMKLPLKAVETALKGTSYRLGYAGMCLVVGGDEEVFFDFNNVGLRDDCVVSILLSLQSIDPSTYVTDSGLLSQEEVKATELAKAQHQALLEARRAEKRMEESEDEHGDLAESMMFDDPSASVENLKPAHPLRITCLTIGSRGDVQPYIALCKGLLKEGHQPKIATHAEFGPWIENHGIEFEPIEGDPAVLMQLCVDNGMFTLSFMREASLRFRSWIEGLMDSAWKACQNSDVIIESPSAMVGIHISEALQVPYFRAFSMPWTRTRAFPHSFFVPNNKSGGTYNYMTYTLFDTLFWKSTAGQINAWRKRQLGLRPTSLSRMAVNKIPFLYNFSKHVVRQPLDWSEWVRITGYWFLDEEQGWTPPEELLAFIRKAREDGKKLVYIGFGSITVENPAALTETVVRAIVDNDLRCVLSKGWSERLAKPPGLTITEPEFPPEVLQIKYSVPHSWLFPQMDAIAHHGGAGTTGASLRAGKPTIIKPFFGDQYFWGGRVEDLGVGIHIRILNEKKLGRALYYATHDERMRKKAEYVGEQIRSEDGVAVAIHAIYRDLDYARSLVQKKLMKRDAVSGDGQGEIEHDMEDEQWTLVGEEDEAEFHQMQQSMYWNEQQGGLDIVSPVDEQGQERRDNHQNNPRRNKGGEQA